MYYVSTQFTVIHNKCNVAFAAAFVTCMVNNELSLFGCTVTLHHDDSTKVVSAAIAVNYNMLMGRWFSQRLG